MNIVEGVVEIGSDRFADVGSFVDRLDSIGETHDVTVQAFDARYVVSRRHLERALELADREREIDRALEMGVADGKTPLAVAVAGSGDERAAGDAVDGLLDSEDTLGDFDEQRVRSFYDLGAAELDATDAGLEALVLERVALLVVER